MMPLLQAEFGTKAEFQFPSAKTFPRVDVYDAAVEKVSLEKMTELGEELISRVTQYSPEVICEAVLLKVPIPRDHEFTRGAGYFPAECLRPGDRGTAHPRTDIAVCRRSQEFLFTRY